ncbi:MAG: hypothetical protein JEZ11_23690 [Desulfobacterales bacterium]|nr:hypothetical protein [Desulfobacterales bacterium]
MVDKGNKICRFYPEIRKNNILIFSGIFLICPLPAILVGFLFGIIEDMQNAILYIIIMDIIFILSSPFIMFIIYYLQSLTIYTNGILSFNPINNRSNFMHWKSMKEIKYNSKIRNGYYIINSLDNNNQLWLPSYIKNREKFFEIVSEHIEQSHIARDHLQSMQKQHEQEDIESFIKDWQ